MFGCKSVRRVSSIAMAVVLSAGVCATLSAKAQSAPAELKILKVDPPNWWAAMPKPMLLVRGEGLGGAVFSLSDKSLRIEKTVISENGHWAQVWLAASPYRPETVTLRARRNTQAVEMKYTFAARRPPADGFAGFSSRDVMYLIMTDRFADGDLTNDGLEAHSAADSAEARAERDKPRGWHGGDLRGVTQHLDYLQQLGVTAVWTTPVYENHEKGSYHGYGATDLYRVDEHYGSLDDLKALASALHARGMKLVLDTVPNHVGPGNPWVHDEPAPDWFHGTAETHLKAETNFHALIDPHASERDRVGTLHGWFANALPDMNTENPAVAQYLRQNAVWWIEQTGADALRIDTFPYVDREFWHEFHDELAKLYPRLTEVGEVFNGDPVITSSFAGGVTRAGVDTGLFTPFDFPTYFALRDVFLKGESLKKLSDVLESDSLYPHPERLVPFLGNHDTTRFSQGTTTDAALRLAFAYLLTTRGMPQIYSGDELAMKGGEDPDNRRDFPGGFPEATKNAFTATGRSPEQAAMFDWVSRLTAIRHKDTALACGGLQMLNSGENWLVFLRDSSHAPASGCTAATDDQKVLVAIHRGQKPEALTVDLTSTWAVGCRVGPTELGTGNSTAVITGQQLKLQMGSDDVLIAACH